MGKHRDDLRHRKTKISEINQSVSLLQAEIEALTGQRASLETAITDIEQRGELAFKHPQAKVTKLEAALRTAKPDMARQLCEYQELMNIKWPWTWRSPPKGNYWKTRKVGWNLGCRT